MKILHVTPYYSPSWAFGGIPRLVHGLCKEQQRLGLQVSVLTTDVLNATRRLDLPKQRSEKGVEITTVPNISHTLAHKQLYLPIIRNQTQKLIQQADIIHLHGYRNILLQWTYNRSQTHKKPCIYTPNGCLQIHESRFVQKKIWDLCFPIATDLLWIAVSQKEKDIMKDQFHIPSNQISVIPNGLDQDEFQNLKISNTTTANKTTKKIGFLGQLSKRKGILDLIHAYKNLQLPHIELHIAGGDMGKQKEIQHEIDSNQHPNTKIVFHGLLEGKNRLQFLQELDLFVYASKNEIFGIAVFEALMCGCPVIVAKDSGCWEWINKAQAGTAVPHGNPNKLKEAIRWNLNKKNRDTIQKQQEQGRSFIKKNLFYSSIAKQYMEQYKKIYNPHA